VFTVALAAAAQAGLVGRRRVLDSTPLYDAVATMDTITLIRSAIRGLLAAADDGLEVNLRALLTSGDDYRSQGKPAIDWDDRAAQADLIDSRAGDGDALLGWLEGRRVSETVYDAAQLLATILGQDLETGDDDGHRFRIARRVAADRIISTVDPHARHGHKTNHRGYDGFKAHIAIDPDSEIITATAVSTPGTGDAVTAVDLLADVLTAPAAGGERFTVYGDAAYGSGSFQDRLEKAGLRSGCKTQPPAARRGRFSKDCFGINLTDDTITCPAGRTVAIRRAADGTGTASFAPHCGTCPLRRQCTDSAGGRTVQVGVFEDVLARARARQADPNWQADYRATRPKVERKLAHLMRRKHGGRRARVRGTTKVDTDFRLLAAAVNLARLATLGLRATTAGWAVATP
jgi:hypothetical protein